MIGPMCSESETSRYTLFSVASEARWSLIWKAALTAHSQGQGQSCAVASFKSEMDGLKIIGRMETPFLALNCYGSFMFCLQETSFLQPVQPTLAKTAVQI